MEFEASKIATDLQDLSDVSLADLAESLTDEEASEMMRRVAPADGTRLLVAASFNSAI